MGSTRMEPSKIAGWLELIGSKLKYGRMKLTPDQKKMAEDFIFSVQSSLRENQNDSNSNQDVEK